MSGEALISSWYEVGTWSSVLIRGVSSFQGCPLGGVPLYLVGMVRQLAVRQSEERISDSITLITKLSIVLPLFGW